ncbi:MAG TPA: large conductance mechanosensitive channel protein MscL [Planctomycetota bacterium]|jgi:large conductance mechanosensitive channel
MKMIKEFRDFVARGNVVDMAVGVIIGAAFGKIITALVNDVIMPPIGKVMGNVNFSDLFVSLDPEKTRGITSLAKAKETGAAIIAYGAFINTVIDFIIVAACIFMLVKIVSMLRPPPAPAPETPKRPCPECLQEINAKAKRCPHCTSEVQPVS